MLSPWCRFWTWQSEIVEFETHECLLKSSSIGGTVGRIGSVSGPKQCGDNGKVRLV